MTFDLLSWNSKLPTLISCGERKRNEREKEKKGNERKIDRKAWINARINGGSLFPAVIHDNDLLQE